MKTSIIIPAFNEERSIKTVIEDILFHIKGDSEIIVVDDGSTDRTAESARSMNVKVISHPYRIGNGAAIKTGMRNASGKIFILMDGDGQHNPVYITKLTEELNKYDMVIGARKIQKNIPLHRTFANILYNRFSSYLVGRRIDDLTSGFRAVKAEIAKKFLYLLPNSFSYPTTLTMAFYKAGHSISYIPIQLNPRIGKSKINIYSDGIRFIVIMLKIATLFCPFRIFLPISIFCFLVGLGHATYRILIIHIRYTGFSIMFLLTGIMTFLMGLIAEQIAQLRLEKSENL